MMNRSLLLTLLCMIFAVALVACDKKAEDEAGGEESAASPAVKACANLAGIAENLDLPEEAKKEAADEEKCVKEFEERAGDCKNGDEVLNCIADISTDNLEGLGKGMDQCVSKCEEKGMEKDPDGEPVPTIDDENPAPGGDEAPTTE